MNKKWSETTTFEKIVNIISWIALGVWILFGIFERTNQVQNAEVVSNIAVCIVCICEAILFWNVKRSLSYVAIGGIVILTAVVVLQMMLLA